MPANSPLAQTAEIAAHLVRARAPRSACRSCKKAKSVAIVGASPKPSRASYFVGTYLLQSSDYRVYFVNPNADTILGHKVYPDLASLPEVPDIVDVFRKASDIPSVIDDVVADRRPDRVGAARHLEPGCRALRREQGADGGDGPLHQGGARPLPRRAVPARLRHRGHLGAQDGALSVTG